MFSTRFRFIRDTEPGAGPLNRFVLVDVAADGSTAPAVIPANSTVIVPVPSGLVGVSIDVIPGAGPVTVAKSNDLLRHIRDNVAGVQFIDWDAGAVTAQTSRVIAGPVSALRFVTGAAACPVDAVVV
jgi:hypothetical protein